MKLVSALTLGACAIALAVLAGNMLAHQHGPVLTTFALAVIFGAAAVFLASDV